MTVSALSAAKSLCEMRDWKLSNLELQKLIYIAHMIHLGQNESPLIYEEFEAWDYGPVVPELYSRARTFGSGPVLNVFHWEMPVPINSTEDKALKQTIDLTKKMKPGQLVAVTHWEKGAWYKNYRPGDRGITIPNEDILEEYRARTTK